MRLFAVLIAALTLALPAGAAAAQRDIPRPGPLPPGTELRHTDDTLLGSERTAMRAARAGGPATRSYLTPDGYRVAVEASSSYAPDPVADQKLVDFLASRVHGPELGALSVYVGRPAEISRICGGGDDVVACYAIHEGRMYVPGESVHGVPIEYALTHEYGHHVASWRTNSPWDALDWGAKHWSSVVGVCRNVRRGLLFPGNQGAHYWDDPGEGFADGYAHLHYPQAPWHYNRLMRPSAAALAAIRRDVLSPWTAPRTRRLEGRLGPRQRSRSFRIRSTLDGALRLRVSAPAGLRYEVEAQTAGYAAGRRLRGAGGLGVEWCRRRPVESVRVTVRRRSGSGPFALRVSWPG